MNNELNTVEQPGIEQIQEDINDVLADSSVVNNVLSASGVSIDAPKLNVPDGIQQDLNVSQETGMPIVSQENPNYLGANDKYADVVPFKLNVFGEDITAKKANAAQIAWDIAVNYNGMSVDDYFGYYYAPMQPTETIGSGLYKGLVSGIAGAIGGVGSLVNAGLQGIATTAEWLGGESDVVTETTRAVGEEFSAMFHDIQDRVIDAFGAGNVLDDSFRTKLTTGIGSVFGSMAIMLGAGAAQIGSKTSAIVLNGATFDEVKRQAMENGYTETEATRNGVAALLGVSALDAFGFEKWSSMFRGITKRTAGQSLEKALKASAMLDAVKRTSGQQALYSLRKGVSNTLVESSTEVLQNNVERYLSGNMGNNYWENYFEEDVITALSSLLAIGITVPLEVRQGAVEQKFAKTYMNGKMKPLVALGEVHDQILNRLTADGKFTEKQANAFLDDLIVNGVEYCKQEHKDAIDSLMLSVKEEDLVRFKDKYSKIDVKMFSEAKFKDLDKRVQDKLASTKFDPVDKLLIRGIYQGIANWMAYAGKSPDELQVADFSLSRSKKEYGSQQGDSIKISSLLTSNKEDQSVKSSVYNKHVKGSLDSISSRASTIIHEMSHLLDWKMIGLDEDTFLKFSEVYLGSINKMFGSKSNEVAPYVVNDRSKRMPHLPRKDYDSSRNATEWFAQAQGRLGREAFTALGLKGEPADYVMFLNSMLKGADNLALLSEPLENYLNEFRNMVKENSDLVNEMVKKHGVETLNSALQQFLNDPTSDGNWKGITFDDIKQLSDIAKSYTNQEGATQIRDIFSEIDRNKLVREIDGLKMATAALDNPTTQNIDTIFQNSVMNEDGTVSYAENVSVDTIAAEQQNEQSAYQKLVSKKVGGHSIQEDIEFTKQAIEDKQENNKPLSKFWKWLLSLKSQLGLDAYLWSLGGEKLVKHYDLIHKHDMFDDINLKYHQSFYDRLQKELFGKQKPGSPAFSTQMQKFENECSVNKFTIKYRDPRDGVVEERKLNTFELMDVYQMWKQDKRNVDENGNPVGLSPKERLQLSLVDTTVDDLVALLTPEQKKYADIQSEEMLKVYKQTIKAYVNQGLIAENFKFTDNYWPLLDALAQSRGKDYTISTIARNIYADSALGIFDSREQMNRYFSHAASVESELYSTLNRIKDVFFFNGMVSGSSLPNEESAIKDMVASANRMSAQGERRLGSEGFRTFNMLLDDFLSNRSENLVSNSITNKIARNITTGILSWKPLQFIKNTSNFFSFWGLAEDQGQYWRDTVWATAHPKEAWDFMLAHSSRIKSRLQGQNYNEFLNAATAGGDNLIASVFKEGADKGIFAKAATSNVLNNFIALTNVAKRAGLSPMIYGDAVANVFGGYGLFQQYLRKNNGNIKAAEIEFDEAITRRQSSSNQMLKSLTQRRLNRGFAGNFLAFTSEGVQKWNNMLQTLEQWRQGEKSGKQATMSAASVMSSMLAYSLLTIGIIDALFVGDDDDDEKKKSIRNSVVSEMVNSVAGASIFGNSVISPVLTTLFGGYSSGVSMPLASELFNLARNLRKGEGLKSIAEAATISGFFVGAPNLLNSFMGVNKAITAETPEERRAGVRQAAGRGEKFANAREGVKEKPLTKDEE